MSANLNGIDLNHDVVSSDRETEVVHGVGVSGNETLTESFNGLGQFEGCSNEGGVVDEIRYGTDHDGVCAEREMGGLDRENVGGNGGGGGGSMAEAAIGGLQGGGEDDGRRLVESLDWVMKAAQLLVGGAECDGGVDFAAVAEGLGLRLKDDFANAGASSSGNTLGSLRKCGGDEIARESADVERNLSMISAKTVIDDQEDHASLSCENVNRHIVGEIDNHGDCASALDTGLIRNAVGSGSLQGVGVSYFSLIQEFFEQLPDKIPVMEGRTGYTNESFLQEDHSAGAHLSIGVPSTELENQLMEVETQAELDAKQISKESGSKQSGIKSNGVDLVVDLNTYVSINGNYDHGNGNQDVVVEDQMTNIEKADNTGKKKVKPTSSKSGFSVSDLVWGKIRSHPWWPGQIFDPSDSSKKSMNYFKKDSFLIAYFGDGTFAWNEASRLKPFGAHFSRMEKQSNMETFRHAVDCALDEVASRVEFGLACPCLSEGLYANIKSQIVVNSGIQTESRRRDAEDQYSSATSFEPAKLVDYIKALGRCSYGVVDRLEFVIAQAQLLSLYRWKGYPQLPEFNMLGGLLDHDTVILYTRKKKHQSEVMSSAIPDSKDKEKAASGLGKSKTQDASSCNCEHGSGDYKSTGKKRKSLSDLMAGNHKYLVNGENGSEEKTGNKPISYFSAKKLKVDDTVCCDSGAKNIGSPLSTGDASKSPKSRQSFRVGDGIRRVASQLNGSTPTLKYGYASSQKSAVKNEIKERPAMVEKSQKKKKVVPVVWSSPDEMLTQLCLAASDPMEGFDFIFSMVSFFSEFRNSVCLNHPSLTRKQSVEEKFGGKSGKKLVKAEITVLSEQEYVEDSYWTDGIIKSNPEDQLLLDAQNKIGDFLADPSIGKDMSTIDSEAAPASSPYVDSILKTAGGNLAMESEKPVVDHMDGNSSEDPSPTALILNFTDLDSVPSETNLNKIFTCYGPLNESETEVLKKTNRAKVVFKRRSDAETAFSSAGKYSIFGPSLVSYRLKYSPSSPQKSSSPATKRSRKTSEEDDTA